MSPEPPTGVLCMAYGSPATEADIEAYYTHIRGGRKPSAEALEELSARYRAIDGSPLTAVTRAQAAALGKQLRLPTFVGMKHAPPFIADGAAEAKKAGIKRLVGLPLAPHYAEMSVGGYERALRGRVGRRAGLRARVPRPPGLHPRRRTVLSERARRVVARSPFLHRPQPARADRGRGRWLPRPPARELPAGRGGHGASELGSSRSNRRAPQANHGWARTSSKRSNESGALVTCSSARSALSPTTWRSFTTWTSRPRPSLDPTASASAARPHSTRGLSSSRRWRQW